MPDKEIKSTELAKELKEAKIDVKATDIVKELARLRSVEFKRGTTLVKLTIEEADRIRQIFRQKKAAKPRAKAVPAKEAKAEAKKPERVEKVKKVEKVEEPKKAERPIEEPAEKPARKPEKIEKAEIIEKIEKPPYPAVTAAAETAIEEIKKPEIEAAPLEEAPAVEEKAPAVALPEEEEIKIPDRFKKEVEVEKVEKFKVKPGMQKAFQAIKKIEPKKWVEQKSGRRTRDRFRKAEPAAPPSITAPRKKSIKLEEGTSVKEFAELIGQKIPDVIKKFMELGYMATLNQPVDMDAAVIVAEGFGVKVETVTAEQLDIIEEVAEDALNLAHRPPVVTIMGHVDHGKTSLLDAIRRTKVTETEAGGITQHIGAYKVSLQGKEITFLDTPGHEAFTALRARGAKITDIVVLVVAADDGVMPQTVEAIDHSKAANVPIVVAVNKIDKPDANLTRVRNELSERGIISEEWGGQNIFVEVSAKQKIGIEHLLEMILLQAEVMELKANPNRAALGTIVEAKLDRGRGPVATVLVHSGTLKIGDAFVAGTTSGKVRALIDDTGKRIINAGPSTPVEIIGFSEVPTAGDAFTCVEDEKRARQVALARLQKQRLAEVARHKKLTLDELYAKIQEGQVKELGIVIKGDVQGSVEAMRGSLEGITHPEVKVRVIHAAAGGINESDVMLATASNAIIIGFNVRPEIKASQLAEKEGVDIRLYNIIYNAIEDVKKALEGMLEPTLKEKVLGRAEVRNTFQVSRLGTIAGCYVIDGSISRASDGIRIIRDNIVVYEGKIGSLKRFKEDVRDVQTGYECGIMIENFNDIKVGDIFENYVIEKIATKL
ncbi:MAG TPA: translation initiation factor IF-2 [Nitrospiraceae bacterium]|nr:translation initiation factor IF-2 [Nitrospiraceae bacterium]HCZ12187.1 translation initiation factor IF-2 [Nitrospiraceae bacterium]